MAKCRSCGAEIVWVKTLQGKNMPIDAETDDGSGLFDHNVHVSHFATCPDAPSWRRDKAKLCPHDHNRCTHDCEPGECWREVEGS